MATPAAAGLARLAWRVAGRGPAGGWPAAVTAAAAGPRPATRSVSVALPAVDAATAAGSGTRARLAPAARERDAAQLLAQLRAPGTAVDPAQLTATLQVRP